MKYRPLGASGLPVSTVGLGTMSWPGCRHGLGDHEATEGEFQDVLAMVAAAREAGVTLFDTAESYGLGRAESLLGRALEELGGREDAFIVSKVGPLFGPEQVGGRTCNLSAGHIVARCERSLARLRTDRIDLYLAHWPDPLTPLEETMQAAATLTEQGKIRAFGVSNFSNELLSEALRHGAVAANQLPYSLVDRDLDAGQRPFCVENNVAILVYSPMGKGVLSGKYDATHLPPADDYRHQRKQFEAPHLPRNLALAAKLREFAPECSCSPSQLALDWVLAQPGMTCVLPGAKTLDQVTSNAGAADVIIPPDILRELNTLSESQEVP